VILSPTCKQALRALIFLAMEEGNGPIQIREISHAEAIPHPFLAKILHSLRNRGLVRSTKGPGGGYELSRPAEQILVKDVITAIDGVVELNSVCILGLDSCSDETPCALHDQWKRFRNLFESTISSLTLKDAASTLSDKRRAKPSLI